MDNRNSGFNMWNSNRNAAAAATTKKSALSGFFRWILLFLAAWWLVGVLMNPRPATNTTPDTVTVEDLSGVPTAVVSSDKISSVVQGLRVHNVSLADFTITPDGADSVTLLDKDNNFIEVGLLATGTSSPVSTTAWKHVDNANVWRNSDGLEFTRNVTADGYIITITDTIKNNSARDFAFTPYAKIMRDNDTKSAAGVLNGAIAYVNSDAETIPWQKLDKKTYAYSTTNGFAGFVDQYWETVVSIDRPDQTIRMKKSSDKYQVDIAAAAVYVPGGTTTSVTTNIFVGPRDQSILDGIESKIPGIAQTIDYGWFWFLARPMLWVLNGIHHIVMNYGVAIIIMTILLRMLMWPLTRKSYVSMAAMQKMQPEMQRIQKLYANDKMRMQMEMMKLYQTHKTSPMSGCLPMLIQIPIFFALYKALLVSVPMRNAHFLWISDLSAMDPYFILPIMMGATMWIQQYLQSAKKNTNNGNDAVAQTQRMMRWMPILFTIMFAWMPAGLVLYWTVSNIFGIIQMQIIKKQSK